MYDFGASKRRRQHENPNRMNRVLRNRIYACPGIFEIGVIRQKELVGPVGLEPTTKGL